MYIFQDKNNQYLNEEVDLRLTELTAQGLIKSEDEYKRVVESTLRSIDADLQRITDIKKYVVKSDDVVSSQQLNALFVDLESDMRILHKELSDIHHVIDITFDRNKLFYRRIKNRIASIWKEIQHFRETSFNLEGVTYIFFESFSENALMYLTGLNVDKKTGTLVLSPAYLNSFNDSSEVAGVEMTLFPAGNRDGGLVDTTNTRNTFEYNYKSGDRTLLKDGLWKVQMLAEDIPEVILDVFHRGTNLNYKGMVAQVDINFVSQKLINEINIDPYGDFNTKVLSVSYQIDESSTTWNNVVDEDGNVVTGSDVDWIVLRNFVPFSAKKLRIVFHQPNYQIINRLLTQVDNMVDKMVKALIEQRFDKINYSYKTPDQFPKYDTSEEANLYDEVMNIIEEGGDITTLESQITNLLVPPPINIQADIRNWKLFNLGAWSIDPRNAAYNPQSVGVYISHDPRDRMSGFKMNNGCPNYAKLYTKQQEPASTSIEWSLMADVDGINYVDIPIIPNNDIWRNESALYNEYLPLKRAVSPYRTNTSLRNSYNMFKLDFPVHPSYQSVFKVMENGKEFVEENYQYFEFYNSTELFISTADFTNGNTYSLKYVPAIIDTVRCWTLIPNKIPDIGRIDFGSMCVFANKQAAERMKSILTEGRFGTKPSHVDVAYNYTVTSHLCTRKEYNEWFSDGYVDTFIDAAVDNDDDRNNLVSWFINGDKRTPYNSDVTKATWLYRSDASAYKPYSENNIDLYTWRYLKSAVPSIKVQRIQY